MLQAVKTIGEESNSFIDKIKCSI